MSTHCSACGEYKSRQHFSKTQLKKFPTRRCKDCVNNDRVIIRRNSSISSYICHHNHCHKNCHLRPKTISISKLSTIRTCKDSFSWQIKVLCVMKQERFGEVYCAFIDKYGEQVSVTIDFSVFDPNKIVKGSVYLISNAGVVTSEFEVSRLDLAIVRHSKIVQLPNCAFHQIKPRKPPKHWDKMEEILEMRLRQMFERDLQEAIEKNAYEEKTVDDEWQLVKNELVFVHNNLIGIIDRIDCLMTNDDGDDYRHIMLSDRTGVVRVTLWNADAHNPMWQQLFSSNVDYNTENKENILIGKFRDLVLGDGILHAHGTIEIIQCESYKQCVAEMRGKYGFGSKRLLAPIKTCEYCGLSGLNMKLCKRCRKVHYCGKRCQKKSWNKEHRYECL